MIRRFFICCCLLFSVAGVQAQPPFVAPEAASTLTVQPQQTFQHYAVATANPYATHTGVELLAAGGSAVDALIAAQLVLTLVEPQSSGIGGGAFLLLRDPKGELQAWDGRETAPAGVTPALFLDQDDEPWPFMDAVVSGRAVGVPGLLRMLEAVHQQHGRLPWATLFEPAITLAEQGFEVSPRLYQLLQQDAWLRDDLAARSFYYQPTGEPWPVGQQLRNPALAAVLRQVAQEGADAFYTGPIAEAMASAVAQHPRPGLLTQEDLASYQPRQRQALCHPWQGYRVCGFPPPSSGHLTLMQMLYLLEHSASVMTPEPWLDEAWVHRFSEVGRLAFADRNRYVADPEHLPWSPPDWEQMLDREYLADRARLLSDLSLGRAEPGQPFGEAWQAGNAEAQPDGGTTHISIVDADGLLLAMTSSIESAFGSRILSDGGTGLAGGFLLNNQLTDFSFQPLDAEGVPVANRAQAHKRPRSSMSPTLVLSAEGDEWVASLGSPGGAAIIPYTARTLIGLLQWQLQPERLVALPHAFSLNGPTLLETGHFSPALRDALLQRGHQLHETDLTSGVQLLYKGAAGIIGVADPRREGQVSGR